MNGRINLKKLLLRCTRIVFWYVSSNISIFGNNASNNKPGIKIESFFSDLTNDFQTSDEQDELNGTMWDIHEES